MIRLFSFRNSLLAENTKTVPAEYSAFGYFDGLQMKTWRNEEQVNYTSLKPPLEINCNSYDILGIREDADDEFWKKGQDPFIFISLLRLKNKSQDLHKVAQKIEYEFKAVVYYSIESGDLIVCMRTSRFRDGYNNVSRYYKIIEEDNQNILQVEFSVLVVWQKVLDGLVLEECDTSIREEISRIEEEKFSVFLRVNVKNWSGFDEFCGKLKLKLNNECEAYKGEIFLLGSEDAVIEIENLDSREFLKLYANDGLLTHGNMDYQKGIYNILTEIY